MPGLNAITGMSTEIEISYLHRNVPKLFHYKKKNVYFFKLIRRVVQCIINNWHTFGTVKQLHKFCLSINYLGP